MIVRIGKFENFNPSEKSSLEETKLTVKTGNSFKLEYPQKAYIVAYHEYKNDSPANIEISMQLVVNTGQIVESNSVSGSQSEIKE